LDHYIGSFNHIVMVDPMTFNLLQRVKIINSREYADLSGLEGTIVKLSQMPGEVAPSISVLLKDNVVDDLLPSDIELIK
jgi:hypothetical protein